MGWPQRRHGTGSLACHRCLRLRHAELAYSGLDLRVPPGLYPWLTCADIGSACTFVGVVARPREYCSATSFPCCHCLLLYWFARAVSDGAANGESLSVDCFRLLSVVGIRGGQSGHCYRWPIWPRLGVVNLATLSHLDLLVIHRL